MCNSWWGWKGCVHARLFPEVRCDIEINFVCWWVELGVYKSLITWKTDWKSVSAFQYYLAVWIYELILGAQFDHKLYSKYVCVLTFKAYSIFPSDCINFSVCQDSYVSKGKYSRYTSSVDFIIEIFGTGVFRIFFLPNYYLRITA